MVYLQITYKLCFGEAYFESCDFSRENTTIDVSVFMFDLRMISMSSECEYDWYWKISACSTEYDICDSFASLTRQQASYSGSVHWYFRYQSIHIQITYNYHIFIFSWHKVICICLHPTPTLSDMRFLQNSHLPTRKVWRYQRGIQKPTCPLIDMSSTLYRLRANQYYTNSSLKRS